MSHIPSGGAVPQFDLADRMRKSLRESGIGVQEMADYLGAGRSTVSNWINGRIRPSVQTLRLWSLRCDVDYDWLIGNGCPRRARGGTVTGRGFRKPGRSIPSWAFPAAVAAGGLPWAEASL